jgi:hypothetical protein
LVTPSFPQSCPLDILSSRSAVVLLYVPSFVPFSVLWRYNELMPSSVQQCIPVDQPILSHFWYQLSRVWSDCRRVLDLGSNWLNSLIQRMTTLFSWLLHTH